MSCVPDRCDREEYLMYLLNYNPDIDIRLLESVKFLMMERALCVYRQVEWRKQYCYPQAAHFWMFMSLCPVQLFQQRINPLGDSVKADEVYTYLQYTLHWLLFEMLIWFTIDLANCCVYIVIRLEARFQPNIGFTFERTLYAWFYWFSWAKFHKIWTQHVDRCYDESFWNRILEIFPEGVIFLTKT